MSERIPFTLGEKARKGIALSCARFKGEGRRKGPRDARPPIARMSDGPCFRDSHLIPSSKVLWGEGLFLRPQHFQRQDAYHEWRTAEFTRMLHPCAWGVRRLRVDPDALATGVLRFTELQVVFPDGELYSAPAEDELPAPLKLTV